MEKGLEFFNAWAKTQKEFLETSLKSQEILRTQWLDTMKKTQESVAQTAGSFDNPQSQEMLKLFNAWFNTVISSSELFNQEMAKIHQSWEKTLENQITLSNDLVEKFSTYLKQAEKK